MFIFVFFVLLLGTAQCNFLEQLFQNCKVKYSYQETCSFFEYSPLCLPWQMPKANCKEMVTVAQENCPSFDCPVS